MAGYERAEPARLRQAPRKCWGGAVAAYLWAASVSGTSYANGQASDIDIGFSDLFDKLDYAFMGYAEIGYDRWSFAIDASTLALEASQVTPVVGARLEAKVKQTLIDLRLGYTLYRCPMGSSQWGRCCFPRELRLDAVAGARYWALGQELTGVGPLGRSSTFETDTDWWDPYVGARFRWPFNKRWALGLYGDVGGFGIGDGSELTWQVQGILRFHITRGLFVALGYRVLDVDRVRGSGTNRTGINATYHGPVLGIGYAF